MKDKTLEQLKEEMDRTKEAWDKAEATASDAYHVHVDARAAYYKKLKEVT